MGNEVTREVQAAQAVIELRKDESQWRQVVENFNAVVPFDCDEKFEDKRAIQILLDILSKQLQDSNADPLGIVQLLEATRRVLRVKSQYKALSKISAISIIQSLNHSDPRVVESALSALRNVIEFVGVTKREDQRLLLESSVRETFYHQGGYETLAEIFKRFDDKSNPLIIAKTMHIFDLVLLTKATSTTLEAVIKVLNLLRPRAESILNSSYSENPDVCYFAIMCTQAIILHSGPDFAKKIQDSALENGALLNHFYMSALGNHSVISKIAANKNMDAVLVESRNLIGLLTDGHARSTSTIKRCIPSYFMSQLVNEHPFPVLFTFVRTSKDTKVLSEDATWMRYQKKQLRRANWLAVFEELEKELLLPHVWWNSETRGEMLSALRSEVEDFRLLQASDLSQKWDYDGFDVSYESVQSELQVNGYYLRTLLPHLLDPKSDYQINSKEIPALITGLYNRAVIEDKPTWKLACIRTMHALYKRYSQAELDFGPLPYLVWLFSPKHTRSIWRDHAIAFFADLLRHQPNARRFVQADGIKHLVFYMSQLHRSVDSEADMRHEKLYLLHHPSYDEADDDEWSLNAKSTSQHFQEQVDILKQIPSPLSRSELAQNCIALLELLLAKLPRLSKSLVKLPLTQNIVQMLLSSDPILRHAIPAVILHISSVNPTYGSRLWANGIIYFLLYSMKDSCDENVATILHKYHRRQVVPGIPTATSAGPHIYISQSVLAPFFPGPIVRAIEVYGAKRFKEIIDGTFHQPDVIWGPSLRKHLIETISTFLDPFLKQLEDKPLSRFDYLEPPTVIYNELVDEICIGDIYLKSYVEQPNFKLFDPARLMQGLASSMAVPMETCDEELVLKSQYFVVERYPDLDQCKNYAAFPDLLLILSRPIRSEQSVSTLLAASLLFRLLSLPLGDNCTHAMKSDAVVSACYALLNSLNCTLPQDQRETLIQTLLKSLNVLLQQNAAGLDAMHSNKESLIEVVKLIDSSRAQSYPETANEAMRLITCLALKAELRQDMLQLGALVYLVRIVVFLPELDETATIAATALSSLYQPQASGIPPDADIKRVLRGMLTPGLFDLLKKPRELIDSARGTTMSPVLIWGDVQRQELKSYLQIEAKGIQQLGSWENYSESDFNIFFPSLSPETVAFDIYLRLYNNDTTFVLNKDAGEFLKALADSIRSKTLELANCTLPPKKVFDHIQTCSLSIARLMTTRPELAHSPAEIYTIQMLMGLERSKNPDLIQAEVLVLHQLVSHRSSISIAKHFALSLHRFLNNARDNPSAHPEIHLILRVVTELCSHDSEAVDNYFEDALIISALHIFVQSGVSTLEQRREASYLLGLLCQDSRKGEMYTDIICKLLAPPFSEKFHQAKLDPDQLIAFFDDDHDTPIAFWTEGCRKDLQLFLASEVQRVHDIQQAKSTSDADTTTLKWDWESIDKRFSAPTLSTQVRVDGIYVNAFNANPYFQVKPDRFFVKLMESLYEQFEKYAEVASQGSPIEVKPLIGKLETLWEAVKNLLVNFPHLQDRCVDYLDYFFSYFQEGVHEALQDTALDVVAVLATSSVCAENIAKFRLLKNVLPLLVVR